MVSPYESFTERHESMASHERILLLSHTVQLTAPSTGPSAGPFGGFVMMKMMIMGFMASRRPASSVATK